MPHTTGLITDASIWEQSWHECTGDPDGYPSNLCPCRNWRWQLPDEYMRITLPAGINQFFWPSADLYAGPVFAFFLSYSAAYISDISHMVDDPEFVGYLPPRFKHRYTSTFLWRVADAFDDFNKSMHSRPYYRPHSMIEEILLCCVRCNAEMQLKSWSGMGYFTSEINLSELKYDLSEFIYELMGDSDIETLWGPAKRDFFWHGTPAREWFTPQFWLDDTTPPEQESTRNSANNSVNK
ncbi:hypothetical protein [Bifidobacterium tissieri]|uniref:hypothetical protein n=1 Tax=Bifidobacterium tissieri TaxID=1630162 RepID=UPI001239B882|nr:hypothetical protein [Bifidobacterium tissieri]KAA8832585.1 hypothetical protein EM849_03505 [Bifidobacterium tissieri]